MRAKQLTHPSQRVVDIHVRKRILMKSRERSAANTGELCACSCPTRFNLTECGDHRLRAVQVGSDGISPERRGNAVQARKQEATGLGQVVLSRLSLLSCRRSHLMFAARLLCILLGT